MPYYTSTHTHTRDTMDLLGAFKKIDENKLSNAF